MLKQINLFSSSKDEIIGANFIYTYRIFHSKCCPYDYTVLPHTTVYKDFVVLYYKTYLDISLSSIVITYDEYYLKDFSLNQLHEVALRNTVQHFQPILLSINKVHELKKPDNNSYSEFVTLKDALNNPTGNYVCGRGLILSTKLYYGSNALLYPGLLSLIAKELGTSYYVMIRTSGHILLVNKESADISAFDRFNDEDVLRNEIGEQEIDKNHVYVYDSTNDNLMVCLTLKELA